MFGGFKGFRPDKGWQNTIVALCGTAVLLGLAGYLDGFADRPQSGKLELHTYQWGVKPIIYTAIMWVFWGCGIMAARNYEDSQMRWGAQFLLSLPIALFLILVFGLVDVGYLEN